MKPLFLNVVTGFFLNAALFAASADDGQQIHQYKISDKQLKISDSPTSDNSQIPNNFTPTKTLEKEKIIKINTGNEDKFNEFKRLFANYGYTLERSTLDLPEIDADPITVVAQKASQVEEGILIEDTSLDIEGASIGVNVRWLLQNLPNYTGKKATWVVLLAYRSKGKILIYEGKVLGSIVKATGATGFGFDPYFLPNGATKTLAESKPDQWNARALAVKALIENHLLTEHDVIEKWDGPWQHDAL